MKRLILILTIVFSFTSLFAEGGIVFEKSYEKAIEKAKKENKLLFISMSINGCSPCVIMEQRVYPVPEVGATYNEKFVNYKVNCSEDVRAEKFADTNGLNVFPSYVWLDPNTETIVHYVQGSRPVKEFIALTEIPFDKERAIGGILSEYKKGNRDFSIMGRLYTFYYGEDDQDKMRSIEKELYAKYGTDFKDEQMAEFYFKYIVRRKSEMSQYLLNNQKKLIKKYGKERIFEKIANLR